MCCPDDHWVPYENVGGEYQTSCQQIAHHATLSNHLYTTAPWRIHIVFVSTISHWHSGALSKVHRMRGNKMEGKRGNVLSWHTFTGRLSINTAKKWVKWGMLSNSRQWLLVKENLDINLNQERHPPPHPLYTPPVLHVPCPLSASKASTGPLASSLCHL